MAAIVPGQVSVVQNASSVSFIPTSSILSSDVQAAIVEVDPKFFLVACAPIDDVPILGVVEKFRLPNNYVIGSLIASVNATTLVATSAIILTVVQGVTTIATLTIAVGQTTTETAVTYTLLADTEVTITVTQTATNGQGLKVAFVRA